VGHGWLLFLFCAHALSQAQCLGPLSSHLQDSTRLQDLDLSPRRQPDSAVHHILRLSGISMQTTAPILGPLGRGNLYQRRSCDTRRRNTQLFGGFRHGRLRHGYDPTDSAATRCQIEASIPLWHWHFVSSDSLRLGRYHDEIERLLIDLLIIEWESLDLSKLPSLTRMMNFVRCPLSTGRGLSTYTSLLTFVFLHQIISAHSQSGPVSKCSHH
jgi:hypothetical protein